MSEEKRWYCVELRVVTEGRLVENVLASSADEAKGKAVAAAQGKEAFVIDDQSVEVIHVVSEADLVAGLPVGDPVRRAVELHPVQ